MKYQSFDVLYFLAFLLLVSCNNDDMSDDVMNAVVLSYTVDGEEFEHFDVASCLLFSDNSLYIESGNGLELYFENTNLEEKNLNRASYSFGRFYQHNVWDNYNSNAEFENSGSLKLNDIDFDGMTVSGEFSFNGKSTGFELSAMVDGVFNEIEFTRTEGKFTDNIISSSVESKLTTALVVQVEKDADNRISFSTIHPSGNHIYFRLGANLNLGVNELNESTTPKDFSFLYTRDFFGSPEFGDRRPINDCSVVIEELNHDDKYVKGFIYGDWANNANLPENMDTVYVDQIKFEGKWE